MSTSYSFSEFQKFWNKIKQNFKKTKVLAHFRRESSTSSPVAASTSHTCHWHTPSCFSFACHCHHRVGRFTNGGREIPVGSGRGDLRETVDLEVAVEVVVPPWLSLPILSPPPLLAPARTRQPLLPHSLSHHRLPVPAPHRLLVVLSPMRGHIDGTGDAWFGGSLARRGERRKREASGMGIMLAIFYVLTRASSGRSSQGIGLFWAISLFFCFERCSVLEIFSNYKAITKEIRKVLDVLN